MLLSLILDVYSLIVLAAVILSWLNLPPENPFVRFVTAATEPVLAPLRRVLPDLGGIDLSPMVLLLVLNVLRRVLFR
jgi:YggT family protein